MGRSGGGGVETKWEEQGIGTCVSAVVKKELHDSDVCVCCCKSLAREMYMIC